MPLKIFHSHKDLTLNIFKIEAIEYQGEPVYDFFNTRLITTPNKVAI